MRDDEGFDYCVDITAVHYPKREEQFDIVYDPLLLPHNERIRVKTQIKDGATAAHRSRHLGRPRTGWSAKCSTCSASASTGIPTCSASCCRTAGRATRCARTTPSCSRTQEWVQINLGIESGQ